MFFILFIFLYFLLPNDSDSFNMSSNSTAEHEDEGFKLYYYDPSLPAAIIFTIAFLGVMVRHCQILFRERTWAFIPFIVGLLCENSPELPQVGRPQD